MAIAIQVLEKIQHNLHLQVPSGTVLFIREAETDIFVPQDKKKDFTMLLN